MAKLYFSYAAMNAGKSTTLLQASYNYRERGMKTLLFTAAFDDRAGAGVIASRIGVSESAMLFNPGDDLFAIIAEAHARETYSCIFIDEAQFLTPDQVWQLARVADRLNIPVMCYGQAVSRFGRTARHRRRPARNPYHLPLRRQGHHGDPARRRWQALDRR